MHKQRVPKQTRHIFLTRHIYCSSHTRRWCRIAQYPERSELSIRSELMYLNGFPMMIIGCYQLSSLKMVMKKTRHRKQQQCGFKSNMKNQRENRLSLCEEAFQIFWHIRVFYALQTNISYTYITDVSKPAFQLNYGCFMHCKQIFLIHI